MNAPRAPMLAVLAILGCHSPGEPARNGPPVITEITPSATTLSRGAEVTITASAADPEGDALTYAWTVPAGFTIVSGQGTSQAVVTTSSFVSGNVELAVNDGASTATAGVFLSTIDGSWGAAASIDTGTGWVANPQVAMDASGNAIAVWTQSDGTHSHILANRYDAATAQWESVDTVLESDADYDARYSQVAMDASGNAIAVWSLYTAVDKAGIYANRYDAATNQWDASATLIDVDAAGLASGSHVAMDAGGNAMAVWFQGDGTRTNIWANRYTAGTTNRWGTAMLLEHDDAGAAQYPQIAMDASGNAMAVWHQSSGARDDAWASRYTAATDQWAPPVLIEMDDNDARFPSVAMDASGNAIAVWWQWDGSNWSACANRYAAAASQWGTATLLETDDAGWVTTPHVVMDASGNAIAVWSQSGSTRPSVFANRYAAGTTHAWGGATLIEADDDNDVFAPQVAMNANGSAVAVWYQSGNNTWANVFR